MLPKGLNDTLTQYVLLFLFYYNWTNVVCNGFAVFNPYSNSLDLLYTK